MEGSTHARMNGTQDGSSLVRAVRSSRERFAAFRARRRAAQRGEQDTRDPAEPSTWWDEQRDRKQRKNTRSALELIRAFFGLVGAQRRVVAVGFATVTVTSLLSLVPPASLKFIVDNALSDDPGPEGLAWLFGENVPTAMQLLWGIALGVFALAVIGVVIGTWGRWLMTRTTKRLQIKIRRKVFAHASRLPLHRIYEIRSGGAGQLLREDAGAAGELLFSMLYNPWRAVVQLAGILGILAVVDWRLLVGALALIPAAWYSQKVWIARIRPMFREVRRQRHRIDGHAAETFSGMRIVRGFGRQRGESSRFIGNNDLLARQEVETWWWSRAIEIVWQLLMPAGSAAVLIYGGREVLAGNLQTGELIMFAGYLILLLSPLEALSVAATSIQSQLAALDRVLDVLDEPGEFESARREIKGEPVVLDPRTVRGQVTLDSVSFRYPGSKADVLQDVSVDIPAGTAVALVGPSGAGKTTLTNLVARFYDPTGGTISFDGTDLRTIDPASYRSMLGIVEQDVFLFDGTIAENIGFARRGATMDQIREAAALANADEFIGRLGNKYDSLIGERGVKLSGGQRQRIAIARALLADPKLLILDEATSNLDSHSEALIQNALAELMHGRTSFIIAHRLSTIRHADLILVLEHGRIVERGTHEQLATAGGVYESMLKLQMHQHRLSQDRWGEPVGDGQGSSA